MLTNLYFLVIALPCAKATLLAVLTLISTSRTVEALTVFGVLIFSDVRQLFIVIFL